MIIYSLIFILLILLILYKYYYKNYNFSSLTNEEYVNKYRHYELSSLTPQLKEIIDNVENKNYYLDIGSGPGDISELIGNNFNNFMTNEPNSSFYNTYNFNNKYLGNISKYIQETNNKDFKNIKFDLITCIHSFYYIELKDYEKVLKKLYNLLNTNGKLIISLAPYHNDFESDWSKIMYKCIGFYYNPFENIKNILSKYDTNIEIIKDDVYKSVTFNSLEEAKEQNLWRLTEELSFHKINKDIIEKNFEKYILDNSLTISSTAGHIIITKNK